MFSMKCGFCRSVKNRRLPSDVLIVVAVMVVTTSGCAQLMAGMSGIGLVRLKQYWSSQLGDNSTTATSEGERAAVGAGYQFVRNDACVYSSQRSETVPLKLYWSSERGDNFTTATSEGERAAVDARYQFVRIEGYVYSAQRSGTVPLKLYWSSQRGDNFTTATSAGEQDAVNAGYQFVRVEGYVLPEC
jgi:hypothetical protein